MIRSCQLGVVLLVCWSTSLRSAPAFDVDAFFAANFIVDGLSTYYDGQRGEGHPFPSPEGPWDFKPLKRETGCNMIIMSYTTQGSFELQSDRFKKGQYLNSRIIRTFDDIRKIRDTGEFGVLM